MAAASWISESVTKVENYESKYTHIGTGRVEERFG
jgi:hypothetical protein